MKTTARTPARNAFTLVEMLLVVGIIAILMALLTPAVMRARAAARNAAIKAEIDMLHMAIMNYKNEFGSFPPENMRGLWDSSGSPAGVNTTHPVYKHLRRVFPRINEREVDGGTNNRSPYFFMAQMSPPQAMVFFLQGYYANPVYPLTNDTQLSDSMPRAGTGAGQRSKLYDFDETRLRAASPYWAATISPGAPAFQTFLADRNAAPAFARDYPVYFPSSSGGGLPYVYFSNSAYSNATAPTTGPTFNEMTYRAVAEGGGNTVAWPYLRSTATPSDSWADCHWNSSSFQLIAAGIDNSYGDDATHPASFPGEFPFNTWQGIPLGVIPGVLMPLARGHEDNLTNFADGSLRDAAEKLLK